MMYLVWLIIPTFWSIFQTPAPASPQKVALVTGVEAYPLESGWAHLSSGHDAELLHYALIEQGFRKKNIKVVMDEDATKKGILKAVRKHLIRKVRPGDIAYFHFSGHGQQVWDDNGDEPDGYDEALVPYDSPGIAYKEGVNEGAHLLRDDELGALLLEVRRKLGPAGQLLVTIDACHSGTGTRGLVTSRGTDVILAPPEYIAKHRRLPGDDNRLAGEAPSPIGEELSPMVAFFASSARERNFETEDDQGLKTGPLSYAFSKTFSRLPQRTTYRHLFDRIKLEMAAESPSQTPQAEGRLNLEIFSGALTETQPYFLVDHREDERHLWLEGGALHDLHPGTRVAFYPLDGPLDENTPIIHGEIIRSNLLKCRVRLDQALSEKEARNTRAVVTLKNYGHLNIRVKMQFHQHDVESTFRAHLEQIKAIEFVRENPDILLESVNEAGNGPVIRIISQEDYPLYQAALRDANLPRILKKVEQTLIDYAQAKYLRHLDMHAPEMDLDLEIVPVTTRLKNGKKVPKDTLSPASKMGEDGNLRFRTGDEFLLKVTHQGSRDGVYYSILDIQPDNRINLLIPNQETFPPESADDYSIDAGESIYIPHVFKLVPPLGTEVFMLIASDRPLHLGRILATRGKDMPSRGDGYKSPFEILFSESYIPGTAHDRTRSGKTTSVPPDEVSISSVVFEIVERE